MDEFVFDSHDLCYHFEEEMLNNGISPYQQRFMLQHDRKCRKTAFTLAETLIVIAVLGIVAMLTVPNVIKQHMEAVARTKIKKSMTVYDLAITKMTVENDLRSDTELEQWADNAEKNDCANTSAYFKAKSCKFKTADGVWWYIDKIMNPIIALSEKDLDDAIEADGKINGKTSFKLVASFDRQSGAFRVDDLGYEKLMLALVSGNNKNETEDNIEELEMLFDFINNKKNDSSGGGNTVKPLLSMQCTTPSYSSKSCTKYDYDSNGNKTAEYHCDGSGNNCSYSYKYEYDSNGNKTAQYDSCDGSGNNCRYLNKYEYDSNGNQTASYYCNGSGNNCSYSYKYEYDSNGNKTVMYYCDGSGNNCSSSYKYEYDGNGKQTAYYARCDGSGNNCRYSEKFEYDNNGNRTVSYYECDGSGNNCSGSQKYEYDDNGNKTAQYDGCDGSGNNCSSSYKFEYDGNGNKTAWYEGCDVHGNNCERYETYESTYIDR